MDHAVIMAGGAGTRLWPLSRRDKPKQVLKLLDGKSLIRAAFERLSPWLDPKQIHVIANARHLGVIAKELPELPEANLIGEPISRDTAAAVGVSASIIHHRDADAVIGVFTADHIIEPVEKFRTSVEMGFSFARRHDDILVAFGITPTGPDVSFGYVKRGEMVCEGVYRVARFAEKPQQDVARQYVASGDFLWNSGMFVWRADAILREIQQHLPALYEPVVELGRRWDTSDGVESAKRLYPSLPKISVDYAIMEKSENVYLVEMPCQWKDLGSWTALSSLHTPDESGHISIGSRGALLDSENVTVVAEDAHLIAAIGVRDLVIVRTADATLVCHKDEAARLKELVNKVEEQFGDTYS